MIIGWLKTITILVAIAGILIGLIAWADKKQMKALEGCAETGLYVKGRGSDIHPIYDCGGKK